MRRSFRVKITPRETAYWPFWPFKFKGLTFDLPDGFVVEVDQVENHRLSNQPITVSGYVSSDGQTMTTSIDFNGGSRLKRITKRD